MFEKDQLSVGDWILYNIIMIIPIVNIVLFFIILSSGETNKTLRNYMISGLILSVVSIILIFTVFASVISDYLYLFL